MPQKKKRVEIPRPIEAEVQFASDRTCCVCRVRGKPIQIHHVDENPANNDPQNLAVLCLECHNDTQIQGGFGRKLNADQIVLYRNDWVSHVAKTRAIHMQVPSIPTAASDGQAQQAELISAFIAKEVQYKAWVTILNLSTEPVYEVIVSIVAFQGADRGAKHIAFLSVVPPGSTPVVTDADYHGMCFHPSIEIVFSDVKGKNWVRSGRGELTEISQSPVDYYKLSRPLGWQLPEQSTTVQSVQASVERSSSIVEQRRNFTEDDFKNVERHSLLKAIYEAFNFFELNDLCAELGTRYEFIVDFQELTFSDAVLHVIEYCQQPDQYVLLVRKVLEAHPHLAEKLMKQNSKP